MADSLLRMGVTGRPHGIKGEISVDWQGAYTPKPGDRLYLQAGGGKRELWRVTSSRIHKGRLLLGLDGVNDRSRADSLKGMDVLLPREDLPDLEEDEAFAQDLPGCEVLLSDGTSVGKVSRIEFPAGRMLWVIMDPADNEILFPAEPCFIKSLDMATRKVVIDPPPGLLDIYRA